MSIFELTPSMEKERAGEQNDEFDYNSMSIYNDLEFHFKKMCNIYIHAKRCFIYAHAIESQTETQILKAIEDSELVQTFRYACARLALIEAVKLLKKDEFSLQKFTEKITVKSVRIRDVMKFQEICDEIANLNANYNEHVALRDKVFAHNDTPAKVEASGAANVTYENVNQLLKGLFMILDDLQHIIPGLSPYHQPLPAVRASEEIYIILSYLSSQQQ